MDTVVHPIGLQYPLPPSVLPLTLSIGFPMLSPMVWCKYLYLSQSGVGRASQRTHARLLPHLGFSNRVRDLTSVYGINPKLRWSLHGRYFSLCSSVVPAFPLDRNNPGTIF